MTITDSAIRPRRSFIFAPGTRPDMFPKALACGTDIVCVDLEDAVAPQDKERARGLAFEHLPAWLASPGMGRGKIAQFYADPAKLAVDGLSSRRSERGRAVATLTSPRWRAYRALASVKRQVRRLARPAKAA